MKLFKVTIEKAPWLNPEMVFMAATTKEELKNYLDYQTPHFEIIKIDELCNEFLQVKRKVERNSEGGIKNHE